MTRPLVLMAACLCCAQLGAAPALVGHWSLGRSGAVVADESGHGNSGKPGSATVWVKGDFGTSILFKGEAANVVEVPDSASLRLGTSSFTIACWACPQQLKPGQRLRLLSKNAGPKGWLCLDLDGSGAVVLDMGDDQGHSAVGSSSGKASVNQWAHLAVAVDRQTRKAKYYLDGKLDCVRDINPQFAGNLDAVGAPLKIGGDCWPFRGFLDDVRLHSRALSDSEVLELHATGKAAKASARYERPVELMAEFTTNARHAVFKPREAVAVKLKVSGSRAAGDTLRWWLLDFRGQRLGEGELPVSAGEADWESEVRVPVSGAGYFELHLELTRQKLTLPWRGSRPPGFLAYAVLPDIEPLPLAHPDDSRFGMQGKGYVASGEPGQGDPFGPLYQLVGSRWVYDQTGQPWLTLPAWLEKHGPNLYQPNLDSKAHLANKRFEMANNLSVIFDLHSVPPWLMDMPAGQNAPAPDKVVPAHNCQDYPPKDWDYYGGLLRRLVSEKAVERRACFPSMRRSYYQIHWEPDWYWKGTDEQFVRMYEIAAAALRDVDPGAFLLGPNYGVLAVGNQRLARLFAKGLGKHLDGVVVHSYFLAPTGENGSAPEAGGVVAEARELMRLVRLHLPPGAPVYNTEGSSRLDGHDVASTPWMLRRQAAWFLRNHLICLGEGFAGTWFFLLMDNDSQSGYGLFYNLQTGTHPYDAALVEPKPVFAATAAATRLLEGTKSLGPLEYLDDNTLGYAFERGDQKLLALWSADDQKRTLSVPVGADHVWFYDPMGNRSELTAVDGVVRLEVGANPVYLLGVAAASLPAAFAVPAEALPGGRLDVKTAAAATLWRAGKALPLADGAVVPSNAQPGVWLLRRSEGSQLARVLPPVGLKVTDGAKAMGPKLEVELENRSGQRREGQLRLCGEGVRADLGVVALEPGARHRAVADLAALGVAAPTRRLLNFVFEDQDAVMSKSSAVDCDLAFAPRATDWVGAPFHHVAGDAAVVIRNPGAPLLGDDDLSFDFAFRHDDQALHLLLRVRDQSHVQSHPGGDAWQEDSVQLGLAVNWDGTDWVSWQKLCLSLGGDGRAVVWRNVGSRLPVGEVSAAAMPRAFERLAAETVYELTIPWRSLDPQLKGPPPQMKLGVGMLVNDVDAPVVRAASKLGAAQAATEVLAAQNAANSGRKAMEAFGGMFWGKPAEFGVLGLLGPAPKACNPACVPEERVDWSQSVTAQWQRKAQTLEAKYGGVQVLFLGDSITQLWGYDERWPNGQKVWDARFVPLKAANLGVAGDRTENLLWRITPGGMLDGLRPKVTVLLIGTNNLHRPDWGDSPDEVAEGVALVVKTLRDKLPGSKILLLGLFPRRDKSSYYQGDRVDQTNAKLVKLADGDKVFYLDLGPKLLNPDGTSNKDIIRDGCHLSEKGYELWADAMAPRLKELLGKP